MKVNSGVTRYLVDVDCRPVVAAPCTLEPRTRRRKREPKRAFGVGVLAAGCATLIGCASMTSTPWRVEPAYRVHSGHPDPAQGYLALARQYEGEQRVAQAIEAYRQAAKAAPADADVQNTVGMALAQQGQFGPAVVALRRAVVLAPERAPLLNNLGYALMLDGRTEEARAMLRLTLAVNPTHESALRNLAYVDQKLLAVAGAAPARLAVQPAPAQVSALQVATLQVATLQVPTAAEVAPVAPPVLPQTAAPIPVPPVAAVAVAPSMASAAPRALEVAAAAAAPADALAPASAVPVGALSSGPVPIQGGIAPEQVGKGGLAARTLLDGVSIEIVNGNGTPGTAARMRLWLRERGVEAGRLANLWPYKSAHTLVFYRPGKADEAHEVAARMPLHAEAVPAPANLTRADLRVLIGHDARSAASCAVLGSCATPERLASSGDMAGRDTTGDGTARR